jgi:hypothetical protein
LVGYRDPYELDDLARWSSGFGSLAAHTFFKRYIALSRTYPDSPEFPSLPRGDDEN